ncbi:uncharacterized protein LOC121425261 isoform X2 [Lytechinus variegatus]|nr:uncharacterized protein LOC121425261 isoform X2 [Lytechinus variegatus]
MSSDVGLNQAELKKATLKSCHSHENDSLAYSKDHFEKFKEEYCWEFQKGKLKYFNKDNPDNSTTTTVVKIERRRGTKMLILRCGPKGRLVFFLEFDSKKLTDEWQEAICQFTGQEYDPTLVLRRVQSDLEQALSLRAKYRAKRSKSAFPDIDDEQMPDDTHAEQEEPSSDPSADSPDDSSSPPETMLAPPSPSDALLGEPSYSGNGSVETDDSDDGTQNASSLRSRDGDISPSLSDLSEKSVKREFEVSDLQQLVLKDCNGYAVVRRPAPACKLSTGDIVVMKNEQGLPMNARELTEYIRTLPDPSKIVLTIGRGSVCVASVEESELVINIKDSQMVRVNPVDAIIQACTSACSVLHDGSGNREESRTLITEINGIHLDTSTQRDQVAERVKEALDTSKFVTIRLVPQSLFK